LFYDCDHITTVRQSNTEISQLIKIVMQHYSMVERALHALVLNCHIYLTRS